MTAPSSTAAAPPLLFNWESPRRRKVAITTFLGASLIAHALCFYIFQIVYPPTVALLPPPARVSMIAPNSEENRTLLRWIEAEDPALAFMTQRPPEAKMRTLPQVDHAPSYLATAPVLKEAPPLLVDLRTPSSRPPGAAPVFHRPPASRIAPSPTTVSFSKEFDKFGAPKLPAPSFATSNNEPAENVRFRVAVNGLGEVRYCFPLNSSGDAALDEQARHYLSLCRFSGGSTTGEKREPALTWGIATVEWGNDVAGSPSRSTRSAAP
jgi:hypothetical protein